MASSTNLSARRSVITTIIVAAVLALVLAGLAATYYILTRPAKLGADQAGQKDRNFLFSIYGFEGDLLRRPTGVGIDSQGNIHVADTGKRRIAEFDKSGNFITTYGGEPGKGTLQLWQPIDVAVADDGRSYVIDKGQKKLVIFDSTHKAVKAITFPEDPTSVSINDGRLFVTTRSGVVAGDLDGKFVNGYVRWGKEKGSFDMPGGVAIGKDGTLYVADSLNYRVQAIGSDGKVKWVYGSPLPPSQAINYNGPDRKFGLPSNLTVDDNGYIYVVDGLSSEIIVLDSAGKQVETMGDIGHNDGTFYYPDGIDYRDGRLVIADKYNDRVEVFSAPYSPALSDRLIKGAPWGLLLLALPLLLLPFLLRRSSNYVMAPSFLQSLEADPQNAPEVVKVLKRVNVDPAFAEAHKDEVKGLGFVKRKPKDDEIQVLMESFDLTEEQAAALDVAIGMRGKAVLLADDQALIKAAPEVEVNVVTYAELLEVARNSSKKKSEPSEPSTAAGDA